MQGREKRTTADRPECQGFGIFSGTKNRKSDPIGNRTVVVCCNRRQTDEKSLLSGSPAKFESSLRENLE